MAHCVCNVFSDGSEKWDIWLKGTIAANFMWIWNSILKVKGENVTFSKTREILRGWNEETNGELRPAQNFAMVTSFKIKDHVSPEHQLPYKKKYIQNQKTILTLMKEYSNNF